MRGPAFELLCNGRGTDCTSSYEMKKPAEVAGSGESGAPERTRTSDARFRKPTLYPLSYGGRKDADVAALVSYHTAVWLPSFWEALIRFEHDDVAGAFTPPATRLIHLAL